MEDKKYKIADLQEKSEEWKIPFSNLLAGFVLEEFMLRFSASEFKNRFLLRNGTVLGLEQYRKKNILKLDFFCEPDERIPEKLLQLYLQKKEQSPVRWKGTISENVTKEVEVGLNLVKSIPLKKPDSWVEELKTIEKNRNYAQRDECAKQLIGMGFGKTKFVNNWLQLYEV